MSFYALFWHCTPWHVYLSWQTISKSNQSWLIRNQHRRSPHVYLSDFHRSILAPVFFHPPTNLQMPVGLKNVNAVMMGWICSGWRRSGCSDVLVLPVIYTFSMTHPRGEGEHFHNVVSLTLSITPPTSLPPPACPHLKHITSSSSVMVWLCLQCAVPLLLQLCLHWRVAACDWTAADAEFYGDLDPQLHLLGIYVKSDSSEILGVNKEGNTVIPPLWLPMSLCNTGQYSVLLIYLASCAPIFTGQMSSKAFQVKLWYWNRQAPQTHPAIIFKTPNV